ncbi:hypothetical protein VP150E351_P0237 [Vibrio phage 150E35-1]|nr:hypothetical protein VP150E351_P0237 [Vibrio phage 150E35-1]
MSSPMLANLVAVHGKAGAQRILALASGYREVPVSIDEFVESDEYLGQETDNGRLIYPGWRERLRSEFPDPFTTKSDIIVLSGCISSPLC